MMRRELVVNSSTTFGSNTSNIGALLFTTSEDIAIKTIYTIVSIADIVGNSVIILIIAKDKRIQNTVNLLIVNLSISDIVAGFAVYPYLFITISWEDKQADLLCGIKNGLVLFYSATTVNFLTLGVLSFSRYMLINHPTKLKWRIRKEHVKFVSIASWIIGIGFISPNIMAFRFSPEEGLCKGYWPKWVNKHAFFSVSVVLIIVPFASLTFTFASTVHTLWFKASTRRLARSNSVSGVQSSRRKVTILLGLLIFALLICWLPFSVFWTLSSATDYFSGSIENTINKLRTMRICLLIAFLNTVLDPVIYAFGNRQIKEGAMKMLRKVHSNGVEPTNTAYD